ncbi:hypothetical protein O6H91_08G038700 [Diphasiastrum complanatum]|nr:hypothetical protein O6H91_08G038700 [Diphasiastrum complanatum]
MTYRFNATMAVIILSLAGAFVALGIFAFYVQKCASSSDDNDVLLRGAAAARRDERSSKGLDCEVLDQFPIIKYSAAAQDLEEGNKGTDCAVCLTEFQQNESVRLLPLCNHSFHLECIDTWLSNHTTCPLCRISLIPVEKDPIALEQRAAEQQVGEASAPVNEDPLGAALERNSEASSGIERAGEREAILVLSRSSKSFRKAVQEVKMKESVSSTSVRFENGSSSRWINKLRRSRSMEGNRGSPKALSSEARDAFVESLLKQGAIVSKPVQESSQITIDIATYPECAEAREGSSGMANAEEDVKYGRWNSSLLQHSISFTQINGLSLPVLDSAR